MDGDPILLPENILCSLSGDLLLACHNKIGHPEEGALEFGLGERSEGLARLLGVAVGDSHGVFDRTVADQDLLALFAADILKAAVVEHPLNGLAVSGRAVVDGVDDR